MRTLHMDHSTMVFQVHANLHIPHSFLSLVSRKLKFFAVAFKIVVSNEVPQKKKDKENEGAYM